jgi:hypothetical protein
MNTLKNMADRYRECTTGTSATLTIENLKEYIERLDEDNSGLLPGEAFYPPFIQEVAKQIEVPKQN